MNVFLKFLAAMATFWCGIELVQPQSAFLAFVVYGLSVWLRIEVRLDAAAMLINLVGKGK